MLFILLFGVSHGSRSPSGTRDETASSFALRDSHPPLGARSEIDSHVGPRHDPMSEVISRDSRIPHTGIRNEAASRLTHRDSRRPPNGLLNEAASRLTSRDASLPPNGIRNEAASHLTSRDALPPLPGIRNEADSHLTPRDSRLPPITGIRNEASRFAPRDDANYSAGVVSHSFGFGLIGAFAITSAFISANLV